MSLRDFDEVWHGRDLSAIFDIYRPGYRGNGFPVVGSVTRTGYRFLAGLFLLTFPDIEFHIHELDSADAYVFTQWTFTATHTGRPFGLPASGASVRVDGKGLHRYAEGRVDETWLTMDWTGLFRQLAGGYRDRLRASFDRIPLR